MDGVLEQAQAQQSAPREDSAGTKEEKNWVGKSRTSNSNKTNKTNKKASRPVFLRALGPCVIRGALARVL